MINGHPVAIAAVIRPTGNHHRPRVGRQDWPAVAVGDINTLVPGTERLRDLPRRRPNPGARRRHRPRVRRPRQGVHRRR